MPLFSTHFPGLICAALLAASSAPNFAAAASPAATNRPAAAAKTDYGTPAEKEQCSQNLRRIHEAIQAYRKDQHEVPNWLSDLVPKYLEDLNCLTCPVSRRTGQLDTLGLSDPKLAISYAYQFGDQPIPASFSGGSKRTMREWKRAQMGIVGDIVPIVRCRHHLPQLNLSFGGQVFESPPGWEQMMTNEFKPADLSIQKLFPQDSPAAGGTAARAQNPSPASQSQPSAPVILRIPARDPQTPAALIDLTDFYNAGLNEPWHARPGNNFKHNNLSWLPKGIQTFADVEFDVRGIIQLAGRNLVSPRFPASVKGLKINRKCLALHFLHATGWSVTDGTRIGHYRAVYADGESREIPIIYGKDVRDWTQAAGRSETNSPTLVIAWSGKSPVSQSDGTTLRLFKSTWQNPTPQVAIDTLEYVSARTNCAPFLIAITAEN